MSVEISKQGTFDAAHRVMNEKVKCFNVHGHTYHYELFFDTMGSDFDMLNSIGYEIDYKEIKRVFMNWIDTMFDHGVILNPQDEKLIKVANELNSKIWLMSLNGAGEYCNPTAENIVRELFFGCFYLLTIYNGQAGTKIGLSKIVLKETPNSSAVFTNEDFCSVNEETLAYASFLEHNRTHLMAYYNTVVVKPFEYDSRK